MFISFLGNLLRRPWQKSRVNPVSVPLAQRAASREANVGPASEDALLRRALGVDPESAEANHRLGIFHAQREDYGHAVECLQRALTADPGLYGAYVDLGNVLRLQGETARAADAYRRALGLNAHSAAAHYNLGSVMRQAGDSTAALPHLERAAALMPGHADAFKELVLCLISLHRFDDAVVRVQAELVRDPASAPLHCLEGLVYQKMLQASDAFRCYERAAALGAHDPEFFNNRGIVLQDLGRIEEALSSYERALDLQPGYPLAVFHRGLARLMVGDYQRGWEDYEVRLVSEDHPRRIASHPRWDGSPLGNRTLLVWGEQGLGDEIMFASCIPDVLASGGRCVIECSPKLEGLFRRSFSGAAVYCAVPDRSVPVKTAGAGIDLEIPMGSLPLQFRRRRGEFPDHSGYLRADASRVARWRDRLASRGTGLKVGLAWQGGTHKTRSPLRSVTLAQLLPLLAIPRACFVSLQYTDATPEIKALTAASGVVVEHWPEAISDYEETAALVAALDVVISVCTAVIHLSGALGKRVWIMAPHSPEWRYGFAGDSMPWYPSARVFRQPAAGEWDAVIEHVAEELRDLVSRRPGDGER